MTRVVHTWVFAYGSNMDLDDLRRWLGEHGHSTDGLLCTEPALLRDHRLVWRYKSRVRAGGAANAEPATGATLPGIVLGVDKATLQAIDQKEGHPNRYSRGQSPRPVELLGQTGDGRLANAANRPDGRVEAWVYMVTTPYLKPESVWPRRAYLNIMLGAARSHGLPGWYISELEGTPTDD